MTLSCLLRRLRTAAAKGSTTVGHFEVNEAVVFGQMDLFSKRCRKLIDLFTTIHQFSSLAQVAQRNAQYRTSTFLIRITEKLLAKGHNILLCSAKKPWRNFEDRMETQGELHLMDATRKSMQSAKF